MNHIRKVVNGNKGFFSFWLILFFINAGVARNFDFTFTPVQKSSGVSQQHNNASKHLLSSLDEAGISIPDQLKDNADADDVEFIFYGNYTPFVIVPQLVKHEFTKFAPYHSIYRVPLYDLFCNWKFHLI